MIEENLRRAKDKILDSKLETVNELLSVCKEYIFLPSCIPAVYLLIGLDNYMKLRSEAVDCDKRPAVLEQWSIGLSDYLQSVGL